MLLGMVAVSLFEGMAVPTGRAPRGFCHFGLPYRRVVGKTTDVVSNTPGSSTGLPYDNDGIRRVLNVRAQSMTLTETTMLKVGIASRRSLESRDAGSCRPLGSSPFGVPQSCT